MADFDDDIRGTPAKRRKGKQHETPIHLNIPTATTQSAEHGTLDRATPYLKYDLGCSTSGVSALPSVNAATSKKSQPRLSLPKSFNDEVRTSNQRLAQALWDITQYEEMLEQQTQKHQQHIMLLKQDLMLDRMRLEKDGKVEVAKLQREKHHLNRRIAEHKAANDQLKVKMDEATIRANKASTELARSETEIDHLESLNKILEEDLVELRRIENDDARRHDDKQLGLPPAYGALPDENRFPPPQLHEDSGALDVAVLKRTIRRNFLASVSQGQVAYQANKPARPTLYDHCYIFKHTSGALAIACSQLRAALDHAESTVGVDVYSEYMPSRHHHRGASREHKQRIQRETARSDWLADRVAKMVLDFAWRVVSSCEVRPGAIILPPEERTQLRLEHSSVDDCLLQALRQTFLTGSSQADRAHRRLHDLQHYSTQLSALRNALFNLFPGLGQIFFEASYEWLGEQIESERFSRANALLNEDHDGSVPAPAHEGTVSSAPTERSGNSGSEGA